MSLSKLFLGNADLCAQMANAAQSHEIKQQWLDLAERWREKETAEGLRANSNAQQLLVNQPLKEEVNAPVATEILSPTPAPSQPTIEAIDQTDIEQKEECQASIAGKHDHEDVKRDMSSEPTDPFWDQLLFEIRNKTTIDS